MLKALAAVLLTLPIASSQVIPSFADFPPQLKSYLELTDDQVTSIKKANIDLNTFRAGKLQRQFQVQAELAQETAKQTPDPMALGLRYVELEAIRRELQAEQQKTATAVQTLLTAQKTKVAALQQALLLYPTACSAVDENVLQPTLLSGRNTIPANQIDSSQGSFASFLLGIPAVSTCNGVPNAIRTGDFIFTNPAFSQPGFGRVIAKQ